MPRLRPEPADFVDRAPLVVTVERELEASPAEVFEVLADTPSWPDWFGSVRAAGFTTDPPHGVGSGRFVVAGPVRFDEVFVAWEPGVRWGFTIVATSAPGLRAGVELVDLAEVCPGRTRLTYRMALEPVPALRWLTRFAAPGIRRGLESGLDGLEPHVLALRAVDEATW